MAKKKLFGAKKVVASSTYPKSPLDWELSGTCIGPQRVESDGSIRFGGCDQIALVYTGYVPKFNRYFDFTHGRFCASCLVEHNRHKDEVLARARKLRVA